MMNVLNRDKPEVWILEDSSSCRFVYEELLGSQYTLTFFETIAEFIKALKNSDQKRVCITDLLLPDGTFSSYLANQKELSELGYFIVVSSLDDLSILRSCLSNGVVDYLVKPFRKVEILAKLENFISRVEKTYYSSYLDQVATSVLTLKEQRILKVFLKQPNFTVTRQQLLDSIWRGIIVDPKTIDVHLHNIRRKFSPLGIEIRSLGSHCWGIEVLSDRPASVNKQEDVSNVIQLDV